MHHAFFLSQWYLEFARLGISLTHSDSFNLSELGEHLLNLFLELEESLVVTINFGGETFLRTSSIQCESQCLRNESGGCEQVLTA